MTTEHAMKASAGRAPSQDGSPGSPSQVTTEHTLVALGRLRAATPAQVAAVLGEGTAATVDGVLVRRVQARLQALVADGLAARVVLPRGPAALRAGGWAVVRVPRKAPPGAPRRDDSRGPAETSARAVPPARHGMENGFGLPGEVRAFLASAGSTTEGGWVDARQVERACFAGWGRQSAVRHRLRAWAREGVLELQPLLPDETPRAVEAYALTATGRPAWRRAMLRVESGVPHDTRAPREDQLTHWLLAVEAAIAIAVEQGQRIVQLLGDEELRSASRVGAPTRRADRYAPLPDALLLVQARGVDGADGGGLKGRGTRVRVGERRRPTWESEDTETPERDGSALVPAAWSGASDGLRSVAMTGAEDVVPVAVEILTSAYSSAQLAAKAEALRGTGTRVIASSTQVAARAARFFAPAPELLERITAGSMVGKAGNGQAIRQEPRGGEGHAGGSETETRGASPDRSRPRETTRARVDETPAIVTQARKPPRGGIRLSRQDWQVMRYIGSHGVVLVQQLIMAMRTRRTEQDANNVRRRVRRLKAHGFVTVETLVRRGDRQRLKALRLTVYGHLRAFGANDEASAYAAWTAEQQRLKRSDEVRYRIQRAETLLTLEADGYTLLRREEQERALKAYAWEHASAFKTHLDAAWEGPLPMSAARDPRTGKVRFLLPVRPGLACSRKVRTLPLLRGFGLIEFQLMASDPGLLRDAITSIKEWAERRGAPADVHTVDHPLYGLSRSSLDAAQ